MGPAGGLCSLAHGFSVLPNDPIEAFLEGRESRGLSVTTIKFYKDYLERLQNGTKSPLLVTDLPANTVVIQLWVSYSSLACTSMTIFDDARCIA